LLQARGRGIAACCKLCAIPLRIEAERFAVRKLFQYLTAVICLLPTIAAAQPSASDAASARAFFQAIYRSYSKDGKGIDPLSPAGARVFDQSFRGLVRADVRAAGPGEVGVVDFDILCACQDWDSLRDLTVTLRPGEQSVKVADVSFVLGDGPDAHRNIEVALVRIQGEWRIHNVIDRSDSANPFDVRAAILRELYELKRRPVAKSQTR
jgi:hypothetical protein